MCLALFVFFSANLVILSLFLRRFLAIRIFSFLVILWTSLILCILSFFFFHHILVIFLLFWWLFIIKAGFSLFAIVLLFLIGEFIRNIKGVYDFLSLYLLWQLIVLLVLRIIFTFIHFGCNIWNKTRRCTLLPLVVNLLTLCFGQLLPLFSAWRRSWWFRRGRGRRIGSLLLCVSGICWLSNWSFLLINYLGSLFLISSFVVLLVLWLGLHQFLLKFVLLLFLLVRVFLLEYLCGWLLSLFIYCLNVALVLLVVGRFTLWLARCGHFTIFTAVVCRISFALGVFTIFGIFILFLAIGVIILICLQLFNELIHSFLMVQYSLSLFPISLSSSSSLSGLRWLGIRHSHGWRISTLLRGVHALLMNFTSLQSGISQLIVNYQLLSGMRWDHRLVLLYHQLGLVEILPVVEWLVILNILILLHIFLFLNNFHNIRGLLFIFIWIDLLLNTSCWIWILLFLLICRILIFCRLDMFLSSLLLEMLFLFPLVFADRLLRGCVFGVILWFQLLQLPSRSVFGSFFIFGELIINRLFLYFWSWLWRHLIEYFIIFYGFVRLH